MQSASNLHPNQNLPLHLPNLIHSDLSPRKGAAVARDDLKANQDLAVEADSARFAELLWASLHGVVSLKLTCSNFLATSAEELVQTIIGTMLAGLSQA